MENLVLSPKGSSKWFVKQEPHIISPANSFCHKILNIEPKCEPEFVELVQKVDKYEPDLVETIYWWPS